ncbi:MAG: Ni/Fe-hydrogenase, b-type cytochrome subunit [Bryobacterales bacterium]|nr:Ni/Fe-hydrogenase, b-type cytochrome subunit [Bryobacterales bacterium]
MANSAYRPLETGCNYGRKYVWELPVRVSHWVNAVSVTMLFATGLYISDPILAPNGEPYQHFVMGRARQMHFLFGYLLLFSFLLRVYWFYAGNNYARSGFPRVWKACWWKDVRGQGLQYLRLERGHVHLGHNAIAGLTYTIFVIFLGWFQILSGLALYSESNPGGFWDKMVGWLIPLFGGSFTLRMWHHTAAWGFVVFVIPHLYIVLYDDRQYKNGLISSMLAGFKFYERNDLDHDRWIS